MKTFQARRRRSLEIVAGTPGAPIIAMGHGARRFTDLRAWQACVTYKRAVYRMIDQSALSRDWSRRDQLEASVAGPPAHIAEGFGRFNPGDFARFVVIARSSLLESQNHLIDAVDRGRITEATHQELHALAEAALQQVTGLLEYLHSADALRNARRARERRITNRETARQRDVDPRTPALSNPEPPNPEPPNPEPPNPEP